MNTPSLDGAACRSSEEGRAIPAPRPHASPAAGPGPSIPDRFEAQVERHPSRTAIEGKDLTLSYDALNRIANRLARSILAEPGPGTDQVALVFEQGPVALAAMIGALKAGKTYVPLDPSYPKARTDFILEDSQAALVLTDRKHLPRAEELAGRSRRVLDVDALDAGVSDEDLGRPIPPETNAYILYTSGSTGRPKGVVQTHRNLLHFIRSYTESLGITAADRLSLLYSLSFSASLMDIYGALLTGAAVVPYDVKAEGVAGLAVWLSRQEVTVYHSVPTVLRHLAASLPPGSRFPLLRVIDLGGEPVSRRDVDLCRQHLNPRGLIVNHLAFTEASVSAQFFVGPETEVAGPHVPAGSAAEGVQILLWDEHGREVADGQAGEIVVRSRFLSPGYWRDPDLTRAAFSPGPDGSGLRTFRTGDMGRRDPEGRLEHLGRKDFRVKVRGFTIEVAEIEAALLNLGTIREAAVVTRTDPGGEPQLVAYVVPRDRRLPPAGELRRALAGTLPDYMIPPAFVPLPALPLTPSGKVDRRALPEDQTIRPDPDRASVAPRTAHETLLARLWEEVLGIRPIGATDDFFALGGTSLQAADLFVRIQRQLGKTLPIATLFENPTVAHLARIVGGAPPPGEPSLVTIQAGGSRPPLFCAHCGRGHIFHYSTLARLLGPDQPVYGLQPRGLDGRGGFDRSIEEMAARYVREIRARQPAPPYLLCGHSSGGIVAFEMAQQLRRQGFPVAFVGLFDTTLPCPESLDSRLRRHSNDLRRLRATRLLPYVWVKARGHLQNLAVRGRDLRRLIPGRLALALGRPLPLELQEFYYFRRVSCPARRDYVPQVYPGRVVLFRARDQVYCAPHAYPTADLGWQQFVGGGLTIDALPGIHEDLVREPTVRLLAEKLKIYLDEALAHPPDPQS